jgi:hypothetical protein
LCLSQKAKEEIERAGIDRRVADNRKSCNIAMTVRVMVVIMRRKAKCFFIEPLPYFGAFALFAEQSSVDNQRRIAMAGVENGRNRV